VQGKGLGTIGRPRYRESLSGHSSRQGLYARGSARAGARRFFAILNDQYNEPGALALGRRRCGGAMMPLDSAPTVLAASMIDPADVTAGSLIEAHELSIGGIWSPSWRTSAQLAWPTVSIGLDDLPSISGPRAPRLKTPWRKSSAPFPTVYDRRGAPRPSKPPGRHRVGISSVVSVISAPPGMRATVALCQPFGAQGRQRQKYPPGRQKLAIVGRTGCPARSTMVKLLARLMEPTQRPASCLERS